VLAKANRVTRGSDYRAIVRRGKKYVGSHTVTYIASDPARGEDVRFGFIVSKRVGKATRRNLVRRRLKAACYELIEATRPGSDVVVRALPGSDEAPWATLLEEISRAVRKGSSPS
jgi:ribonuclease P protein component